jgi:pentatricopeptide repeat protein
MKCGSIDNAQNVFENMATCDVISWNVMLLGYLKCGQGQKALALSRQMQQDGVQPDAVTFIGFLNVCASAVALEEGKHIHKQIIQSQYKSDVFVGSSLIDMYGKCGSIEDAEKVFNRMPTQNVVAWSAMIQAHVKCGQGQKALALSRQMQRGGVEPDPAIFVAVLNACAILAALEEGRHIEEQIIQRGYQSDVFVIASLLDMYAKCGSIVNAQRVFNSMPTQHVVCWTAMLGCYAMHGHAKEALGHFEQMCEEGIQKNDITFVSLLSACSHAGLVDEGLHYFESMSSVYSISATLEHYTCMVGLLGRAGYMHEAKNLINMMSCESDSSVWRALLGACRVHGDLEMGEYIAKKCFELNP